MDHSRTLRRPTIGELIFSKEDDVGFITVFLINGVVVYGVMLLVEQLFAIEKTGCCRGE